MIVTGILLCLAKLVKWKLCDPYCEFLTSIKSWWRLLSIWYSIDWISDRWPLFMSCLSSRIIVGRNQSRPCLVSEVKNWIIQRLGHKISRGSTGLTEFTKQHRADWIHEAAQGWLNSRSSTWLTEIVLNRNVHYLFRKLYWRDWSKLNTYINSCLMLIIDPDEIRKAKDCLIRDLRQWIECDPANIRQLSLFDQCWASVEDDGPTLIQQLLCVLCNPANTRYLSIARSILGQCRRRWTSTAPTNWFDDLCLWGIS